MNKKKFFKTCFVPECKSTTIRTPDKLFFSVPRNPKVRKIWFEVSRRADKPGQWNYYCCQDHFVLKEDMDNYIRYSLMGAPIKLKEDAIPHIFECQTQRSITSSTLDRSAYKKINRKRLIADILSEAKNETENVYSSTLLEKSPCKVKKCETVTSQSNYENSVLIDSTNLEKASTVSYIQPMLTPVETETEILTVDSETITESILLTSSDTIDKNDMSLTKSNACKSKETLNAKLIAQTSCVQESLFDLLPSTQFSRINTETQSEQKVLEFGESPGCSIVENSRSFKNTSQQSVGLQVMQTFIKPHFRSKSVLCKTSTSDVSCQTKSESHTIDRMCSPIFLSKSSSNTDISNSVVASSSSFLSSEYQPSSQSEYQSSTNSEEKKENNAKMKASALNMTRYFISLDAKKYIGIDNDWIWIISLLHSFTNCGIDDIKLTLMKIKTNDTFSRLGDEFGISTSQASRIFNKTVDHLAHYLKTLVYCPDPSKIKQNLPLAFRAHYSNVCAILDAFEIEIEKPSNPVEQTLTWSEYKKCNTVKYLIACTPDGFIIFISNGYGGRISDTVLFEESKLLDILPANSGIMADRGFKNIQTVLSKKNCELLRPPSVSAAAKLTKEEVSETKRIASLRIHVERVIRRVREYKILEPHSCIDMHMMSHIDNIVQIVTGLINLQKPIIRK